MCVGLCYRGKEGRGGRAPHLIRVRDRDLFDIVVEEEKTLAKFLLGNGGEGHRTERSGRVCVRLSLLQRERDASGNASHYGERDLWNRGWEARNSRLFSKMVRSEGKTPTRRATVCMWVSAAEARKAEGRAPHVIRVRDRDLFDIIVGEEKTLAKFLLDNGGEGTERRGADVCVRLSLLQREKEASGTRRVVARETIGIVVGKLETLAFFSKNGTI